jgi:hypothetical protein
MARLNLMCELGVERIPQVDLEILLQWRFKNGHINPADPLVTIHSHDAGVVLRSVYDKRGNLIDLVPGEDWAETDFVRLKQEIDREAAGATTKVRRNWVFASVPTTGSWRYRDRFQLCAPPPPAPLPDQLVADHPLVLEVTFVDSEHSILQINRSLVATRQIELLLSVLIRFGIHALMPSARKVWAYVHKQQEPLVLGSELRQVGYTCDDFTVITGDFSPPGAALPVVALSEYVNTPWIGVDETLSVPAGLEQLLDVYYGLSQRQQTQFLRACYWFQHADRVSPLSMSATYTALIQAIETLLPAPRVDGHCTTCNRRIGPGPTNQFIEFVEEHAPGLPQTYREHLYRVRSKLIHGNQLLNYDEYRDFGGSFTPLSVGQRNDVDQVHVVARAVLIKWLANQHPDAASRC